MSPYVTRTNFSVIEDSNECKFCYRLVPNIVCTLEETGYILSFAQYIYIYMTCMLYNYYFDFALYNKAFENISEKFMEGTLFS